MIDSDVINETIDRAGHVVLVVDDNAATRYSTARVLRAAGFHTLEAGSAGEALALIANGVSAVVLDVHLPDMSGFEVCRLLRADPVTAALPVVHLSAEFTRNEDRVAGLEAGADAYLVHPVEPAVLVATVQALVRARTAEEGLRRSELRLRAIYDHAPSGILVLGAQGRIIDANPAMSALLGYSREELEQRGIRDLVPADWQHVVDEQAAEPAASTGWRGRFPMTRADGSLVHLEWSLSARVEPGIRVAIATDASERVRLEQQRREVLEREQAARAEAERHSRTKDDFIAVLSHELRTPLNAILGWASVLLRTNPRPDSVKGLQAIERNVKAQARIISDILDVSRINAGKLRLVREDADPAEIVTNAIGPLRASIDDKQLRVTFDLEAGRGRAWIDPGRFEQIFWNLMTNAIKFSERGGEIRVGLVRSGPRLVLTVQDFGAGIEAGFMPQLFDRFTQEDSPGNRRHGGLGLGLSIVRHLAELHGGSIHARSAGAGQGTTMVVELAVDAADSQPSPAPAATDRLAEEADSLLDGLDVLVVEDDRDASQILGVVLADRGATVRTAPTVDVALSTLDVRWPDVLLSDIGLPGRDGYELIRALRAREKAACRAPIPAIALTAFARTEDRQKSLEAGFDEHLGKPINPHGIATAINALLAKRLR